MIKTTDLNLVQNKKFTEFSDVIKSELHSKLSQHDTIMKFNTDIEQIATLKTQFTAINNPTTSEEGETDGE